MRPDQLPPSHEQPRGWHGRGYLPHFDAGASLTQFVTFRLADSVPQSVIDRWHAELLGRPEAEREAELYRLVETFLDTGLGACHLRDPRVGALVEGALLFFDGERYRLWAWVVMPNHVHALFTPLDGWALSGIVAAWKSFTAKQANKVLGRTGRFWQEDYFDRYVRNGHHFGRVIEYTEHNPVKAGLCADAADWPFGSATLIREAKAAGTAALHREGP